MKLRQKLAAVLAATMLATTVPVVTMAASDNTVSHAPIVAKDQLVGFATTTQVGTDVEVVSTDSAPRIAIKYKDAVSTNDSFILKATDSEFQKLTAYDGITTTPITGGTMKLTRLSSSELLVEVTPTAGSSITSFQVPTYVKATGAVPTVEIIAENSQVTAGKYIIAQSTVSDKKAVATVADAETFYDKGTLAKVTVIEAYPGAFTSEAAATRVIKVTLENDDFAYDLTTGDVVGQLTRGASQSLVFGTDVTVDPTDSGVLLVKVPNAASSSVRLAVELNGIKVSARNPEIGDINVTVGGELLEDTTLTAAKVAKFNVGLTMKDSKVVDIKAGRSDEVTFTLKENIDDSIAKNREMEVSLDNGHFMHGLEAVTYVAAGVTVTTTDLSTVPAGTAYTEVKATSANKINKALTLAVFKKDYLGTIKQKDAANVNKDAAIAALIYSDKEVVGFEFLPSTLVTDKKDEFTFENAKVEIDVNNTGKVTLKVAGERAIGEAVSVEAVNIITPVTVEASALTLKVGLKEQIGGKVTITETAKAMLKKGETLTFKVADIDDGLSFNDEPEIKVIEGDLKLGTDIEVTKTAGVVTLTIKRESKTPTKLEISNFNVKVDRTVPEGKYDLKIGGKALTECEELTVADFFVIATPNTSDVGGMKKGTSSFVIGSKTFTVDGAAQEMDAAPFIQNGRTMIPVRFVSQAFGIESKNILFSQGTVTILAGSRTLQITNGSDIAVLNGAKIKMDGKVVIKEGRTYVPVAEMGKLLGVSATWDNTTKTATFSN